MKTSNVTVSPTSPIPPMGPLPRSAVTPNNDAPISQFRCAGCPFRSKAIGPRGPVDASIVVVAEAPGQTELITGKPLVGPSGKLLQRELERVGLNLDECFITNSLSCRPPVGENIPRQALDACNTRLIREITTYPRELVLSFGKTALRSLTGKDAKITTARGKMFTHPRGFRVLPTFHPAAILRSGGSTLPQFQTDLLTAKRLLDGTQYDAGTPEYIIVTEPDEIDHALRGLNQCTYLAADIETASTNRDDFMLCIGIAWAKNKVLIFPWETVTAPENRSRFAELFANPSIRWTFHNGQFDTSFIIREGFNIKIVEDTILQSYVLDESPGTHGLKYLSAVKLGINQDGWTNDLHEWLGADPESDDKIVCSWQVAPRPILYKYLAQDCSSTFQLRELLDAELDADPKLRTVYNRILIPASNFFREVEMYGMYIDQDERQRLKQDTTQRLYDLQLELQRDAWQITGGQLGNFNPDSPKQVAKVIYDYLRLKPYPHEVQYFEGTTAVPDLDRLQRHPFLDKLKRYRKIGKAKRTYIDGLMSHVSKDGRIRSSYMLYTTVTGRPSSKPNLQNITKFDKDEAKRIAEQLNITLEEAATKVEAVNVKAMFAAPPGRILIEPDLGQAELRVLAAISGDPLLKQIFQDGRDLHSEVAARMFGQNFTEIERRGAKTINFGVVYGLSAAGLAKRLGITIDAAQELINNWFALMPKAHQYLEWCASHPQRGIPIRSPLGRLRRWGMVTKENIYNLMNQAKNAPIQVTTTDLMILSCVLVQPILTSHYDASIVNFVHDSAPIECPDDLEIIEAIKAQCERIMTTLPGKLLKTDVPFKVDFKVGRNWGLM